ncbi:hypothetical protein [Mucilaginibacter sp.]|uniref:hypothetical protein n=1 Tax=Mucilaginibacter sp. TaxID=1882438 RepID=UPI002ED55515
MITGINWWASFIRRFSETGQRKLNAISSPAITQEAVASFLKSGRYENHLRKLRQTLQSNYQHYITVRQNHKTENKHNSRKDVHLAKSI